MSYWESIFFDIGRVTGKVFSPHHVTRASGGCIHDSHIIDDGERAFFVKIHPGNDDDLFQAEAEGLEAIRSANAIRVPRVITVGVTAQLSYLVLERLNLRPATVRSAAHLGELLACQHRVSASSFGWHRDNHIGATPQPNSNCREWSSFWRRYRLGHQLSLAQRNGASRNLVDLGEQLLERLDGFFAGYRPAVSLLHGDLWGGNWAVTTDGQPVVFDPAVYFGDREADLAMTELFGGFPADFYAAYRQAWPLETGYPARRALYNLYHVLNHLNLFGGGYQAQAERMLGELLAQTR